MKKLLSCRSVFAILILSCSTMAQVSESHAKSQSVASQIKEIRSICKSIDFQLQKHKGEGQGVQGDGNERLSVHSLHGKAAKIFLHSAASSNPDLMSDLYYRAGKLCFVFEQEFYYDKAGPSQKLLKKKEGRFYFFNGKMVRWIDGSKIRSLKDKKYIMRERQLLSDSARFLKYMRSPNRHFDMTE